MKISRIYIAGYCPKCKEEGELQFRTCEKNMKLFLICDECNNTYRNPRDILSSSSMAQTCPHCNSNQIYRCSHYSFEEEIKNAGYWDLVEDDIPSAINAGVGSSIAQTHLKIIELGGKSDISESDKKMVFKALQEYRNTEARLALTRMIYYLIQLKIIKKIDVNDFKLIEIQRKSELRKKEGIFLEMMLMIKKMGVLKKISYEEKQKITLLLHGARKNGNVWDLMAIFLIMDGFDKTFAPTKDDIQIIDQFLKKTLTIYSGTDAKIIFKWMEEFKIPYSMSDIEKNRFENSTIKEVEQLISDLEYYRKV